MIKTIILTICFISVSSIGLFVNRNYKKRLLYFKDYLTYLNVAIEGIRNTNSSKEEISEKAKKRIGSDFKTYLEKGVVPKYVKKQESEEIDVFFERFGSTDLESTMELLQDKKAETEGKVSECETSQKQKGGLIMRLSILAGIALVIILV